MRRKLDIISYHHKVRVVTYNKKASLISQQCHLSNPLQVKWSALVLHLHIFSLRLGKNTSFYGQHIFMSIIKGILLLFLNTSGNCYIILALNPTSSIDSPAILKYLHVNRNEKQCSIKCSRTRLTSLITDVSHVLQQSLDNTQALGKCLSHPRCSGFFPLTPNQEPLYKNQPRIIRVYCHLLHTNSLVVIRLMYFLLITDVMQCVRLFCKLLIIEWANETISISLTKTTF